MTNFILLVLCIS